VRLGATIAPRDDPDALAGAQELVAS